MKGSENEGLIVSFKRNNKEQEKMVEANSDLDERLRAEIAQLVDGDDSK